MSLDDRRSFLASVHPYDGMEAKALDALAPLFQDLNIPKGQAIYALGQPLEGLYLVRDGEIEVTDENGVPVSLLGARNSFGERGLTRGGQAVTSATAIRDSALLMLPKTEFDRLLQSDAGFARFFDRRRSESAAPRDLATTRVDALMAQSPLTCRPDATVQAAAQSMAEHGVSCLCVAEGHNLRGIVTTRDLAGRALAQGLPLTTPVSEVMTCNPLTLSANAIGSDVLHAMMERRIGHLPITESGQLVGIVTQTDLTRFQASTSAELIRSIARASDARTMAHATTRIPDILVKLVGSGLRHDTITRLITDIADAVTRRLLTLAENQLGPAPVPYLWLACGSQGRQEQTGVSDQDNCLFLSDDLKPEHATYFQALATYVCDGLNTCGYVYCPGDMMATNPRWRQPLNIWRSYFKRWIAKPDPEAQMLASVMFGLRPIGGDFSLFASVQEETLAASYANSIFVAHMISNSLKHTPPLSLLRGLATIRSGEHRNTVDLKHNGVAPVVDLGRIYALKSQLAPVNTRARLVAAQDRGALSPSGARDLLDAYDLIATARLDYQADQIRAGQKPDNFLPPAQLSDFERSHLRDAFVVVKTLQSALGHGKGMLG